jgi:hypothetical protein
LQADELTPQGFSENLGDFGFANSGFTFEEQGAAHFEREENNSAKITPSDIARGREKAEGFID